ncbi:sugar ABC transporter ATP-binding protein [Trinickia symbiotica]|uniref:Sugar ABC transporter ATP-binding protein n=1 Tax=Trinickia symbiotica TaxID=863227 RepID=A0A2N7WS95_9BURK|nr:sugar ABC transporter ATP-binding protein [Trinickia symbiotica]PMS32264.1 sugar ABC transporter ATP-binding protein [Trinickia symbiotica]
MSSPVLQAAGIGKRFGASVALDHIDLAIDAGEVVALMGANGAGKSTLVKILSGVYRADRGTLALRGAPFVPSSPQDAVRRGVATVHQAIADIVVPDLPVADNLLLDQFCGGTSPWYVPASVRRAEAARRAARIGLAVDLAAPLGALPLAAQQQVTIARALATHPALLILDEPTASLSAGEADRLFDLIGGLRDEGVATLLVSHRERDLRRMADRVVVLSDGRVVGDARSPIDFHAALQTMIGRPLQRSHEPPQSGAHADRPAVLSLRGLRLSSASAPFDLDVQRGEVVAIAGPVGSGKSRLARTLFGASFAHDGLMTLDGVRWQPRSPADAIRAGVFMLGEDRRRTTLFPDSVPFATIAGTIAFPFMSRWFRDGFVRTRREKHAAAEAIERFGVRCRGANDRPSHLSGGNQQKVALARWHAEPARLLLLDEPFQGIDVGARADIVRLLRSSASRRATLVFVSDLDEALEVADRIVHFDHGAPVARAGSSRSLHVP